MFRLSIAVVIVVAATSTMLFAAAQHTVSQKARVFSPGLINVTAGEVVAFKNDDKVTHHVYSPSRGLEFELETTEPGESQSQTFSKRGRVEVRCGLHPGMRLVINVK